MFLATNGQSYRAQLGETIRVSVMALDVTPAGSTGATITLTIRRDNDGYYWNGTTFQVAATTVTMTETDATNLPGFYHHDFKPPTTDCGYTMLVTTATAAVVNDPYAGSMRVGFWVDNIDAAGTDLATLAQGTEILAKLGNTNVADEFRRVVSFLDKLQQSDRVNRDLLFKAIK